MKALALALGFVAFVSSAAAQDRELAQELFVQAAEARDAGRWAEARDLLTRSLEAFPHFPTAWNLATALERLDDLAGAERVLVRLDRGDYGTISSSEAASVRTRLAQISRMLGTLVITVGPASADRVVLDEEVDVALDGEGRAELRLVPGTHVVTALSGELRVEETVSVNAAATARIHLALRTAREPELGRLIVAAEDEEATLVIEGVGRAQGRFDRELPPAVYEVALDGETRRIDLRAGETERVLFEDDGSVFESGWFWTGVGLVLAAGGGVVLAIVLLSGVADPVPADIVAPPL
jgi:hypothetical protein